MKTSTETSCWQLINGIDINKFYFWAKCLKSHNQLYPYISPSTDFRQSLTCVGQRYGSGDVVPRESRSFKYSCAIQLGTYSPCASWLCFQPMNKMTCEPEQHEVFFILKGCVKQQYRLKQAEKWNIHISHFLKFRFWLKENMTEEII